MSSAIGSFDRIAARLQRGANRAFDNEKTHRTHVEAKQSEALKAQAAHAALEAAKLEEAAAVESLVAELTKLEASGKLRVKQGFPAVYRQVAWILPANYKFSEASVKVTVLALEKVFAGSDLLTKWSGEIETISAEMKQRDEERAARLVTQGIEDKDYFDRCVITIQNLFKAQNPDVKNFFKLLGHLRDIIVAPRHRGLRGQEIIVEAIRYQMHGYSERWYEMLEKSLVRSAEREQIWREKKAEAAKAKKRQPQEVVSIIARPQPEDRDSKWAEEAQAASVYLATPSVTLSDIIQNTTEADEAVQPAEPVEVEQA